MRFSGQGVGEEDVGNPYAGHVVEDQVSDLTVQVVKLKPRVLPFESECDLHFVSHGLCVDVLNAPDIGVGPHHHWTTSFGRLVVLSRNDSHVIHILVEYFVQDLFFRFIYITLSDTIATNITLNLFSFIII